MSALRRRHAAGFTLVEVLIALAIAGIAAAALFQSTILWFDLSARAANATETALARTLQKDRFQYFVRGLVPEWPERELTVFGGGPRGFSGLTKTPLHTAAPSLVPAELELVRDNQDVTLVYRSQGVTWELERFSSASAQFQFLGADGLWRRAWPPATNPEPGPFNDALFFDTPQLPLAIRLDILSEARDETWIARVASNPYLPQREQDLTGFR